MVDLTVASAAADGAEEPARRRLVREWLASEECGLDCMEIDRLNYEAAAARHSEWAPLHEDWALSDNLLELAISRLENGLFRVVWRPSSPGLSPDE
eukprot:894017-Prymnesium_polylepis.1